jgi:hypothetical protein
MGPLGIAAIAAGAGMANSAIGAWQSRQNVSAQNAFNMEMAKYQWEKNWEAMEYMNKYNSPSEQMRRLREAGLNPKLVYGKGSHTANVMKQAPSYGEVRGDYSGIQPIQIPEMVSKYQNIKMIEQQIKNEKARELNILSDTMNKTITAAGGRIDNRTKNYMLGLQMKYAAKQMQTGIQKTEAETANLLTKNRELQELVKTRRAERAMKELERRGYEKIDYSDRWIIDRILDTIQVLGATFGIGGIIKSLGNKGDVLQKALEKRPTGPVKNKRKY